MYFGLVTTPRALAWGEIGLIGERDYEAHDAIELRNESRYEANE